MELTEFSLNRIFDLNRYRISLTDRPLHVSLQHLTQPLFALSRYALYNVKGRCLTTLLGPLSSLSTPPPPKKKEMQRKKRKRKNKERRERDYRHSVNTLNFLENNTLLWSYLTWTFTIIVVLPAVNWSGVLLCCQGQPNKWGWQFMLIKSLQGPWTLATKRLKIFSFYTWKEEKTSLYPSYSFIHYIERTLKALIKSLC